MLNSANKHPSIYKRIFGVGGIDMAWCVVVPPIA